MYRSSAAADRRNQMHLAVGADGLQEGVLVDGPVNGHGHALSEVRPERGVKLGELLEQVLDGRRREMKLGDAPRQLSEVADQRNPGHLERGAQKWPPTPPRTRRAPA